MAYVRTLTLVFACTVPWVLQPALGQNNAYQQQMQRQMEWQRQQDQMRQQEQMRRQQEQMRQQQQEMMRRQQEQMQRQQEEMRRRQQETMARQQDEVRRRQQEQTVRQQRAQQQTQQAQQEAVRRNQATVRQQQARIPTGNANAQAVANGRPVKLARPLTPGEIRKGFTGRTTGDGKAIIRYGGGVVLVPASRVAGLATKPANQPGGTRAAAQSQNRQQAMNQALVRIAQARAASAGGGGRLPPGTGGRKPANDNLPPRAAFGSFFKGSGIPYDRIFQHRSGVDFSKPTRVTTLKAGTVVCQHKVPGNATGSYFAPCGQSPSSLGISPRGTSQGSDKVVAKKEHRFLLKSDIQVFESTAKGVEDTWSVKGQAYKTDGGGRQYFSNKKDLGKFLQPANS